jgi:hypothetical protein
MPALDAHKDREEPYKPEKLLGYKDAKTQPRAGGQAPLPGHAPRSLQEATPPASSLNWSAVTETLRSFSAGH